MEPPELTGGFYGLGLIGRPNIIQVAQPNPTGSPMPVTLAQHQQPGGRGGENKMAAREDDEDVSTDASSSDCEDEGDYADISERQGSAGGELAVHFNDTDENVNIKGYNVMGVKPGTVVVKQEPQYKIENSHSITEQKYSQYLQNETAFQQANNNNNISPVPTAIDQNLLSNFQLISGNPNRLQGLKAPQVNVIQPVGYCNTTSAEVSNTQANQMPSVNVTSNAISTTSSPYSLQNTQHLYQNAFINGTVSYGNLLNVLNQQLASNPLQSTAQNTQTVRSNNTSISTALGAAINQPLQQITSINHLQPQQQQQQQQLPVGNQYYQMNNQANHLQLNQVPVQSHSPHLPQQQLLNIKQENQQLPKEQKKVKPPKAKRIKKGDLEEMQTDKNFVTCPVCGNQYSKYYYMLKHRHVHMGKTYDCPTCGRTFTHPHNMYRHKRRHDDTNTYLYKCNFPKCGMNFKTQPGLKKHESLKHNIKSTDNNNQHKQQQQQRQQHNNNNMQQQQQQQQHQQHSENNQQHLQLQPIQLPSEDSKLLLQNHLLQQNPPTTASHSELVSQFLQQQQHHSIQQQNLLQQQQQLVGLSQQHQQQESQFAMDILRETKRIKTEITT